MLTPDFEKLVVNKLGRKVDDESPRTKITLNEYNNWIIVFEETLILHSWIYHDKHPKIFFNGGRKSIACDRLRSYMDTYKKNAMRHEGMGLKFLKFHQILHLWWIIRLFGCLRNVDTARVESHHRKKKVIGKQTQRRVEFFHEQTANGEYNYNLFIKVLQCAGIPVAKMFETASNLKTDEKKSPNNEEDEEDEKVSISSDDSIDLNVFGNKSIFSSITKKNRGSSFILAFDYEKETTSAKWLSRKRGINTPNFHPHILTSVYKKFKNYNHGEVGKRLKRIIGFTEYRLTRNTDSDNNIIIRSCPNYRSENDWYDWVQAE